MNQKNHDPVSPAQATAILINTILSGRLLIFPREIVGIAGTSSWLFIILGGLLMLGLTLIYTGVGRRFHKSSLPKYCVATLGPFFGGALALALAASWLLTAAFAARLFSAVIITSILHRVPLETGILVMLFLGTHLATQDVKTMARVQQYFYPAILTVLLVSMAAASTRIKIWRLLPIIELDKLSKPATVKTALLSCLVGYLGFEISAMFMPFYDQRASAKGSHALAIAEAIFFYLLVTITAIGVLGLGELAAIQWPTPELVRTVNVHGIFERLEAPFLALYTLVIFTTIGSYMFGAVSVLTDLFPIKTRLTWPHLLVIPGYYLALLPPNVVALEQMASQLLLARLALVLIIPLLVLPVAAIRGKEDRTDEQQA